MRRALALRLLFALPLALIFAPSPSLAVEVRLFGQPLRLDVTESLFLNYHGDNGTADPTTQGYGELLNRLNVQVAWKHWLFGARFDTGAYANTPSVGDHVSHSSCPRPGDPAYGGITDPCFVRKNDFRLADRFQQKPFYLEKIFASYAGRNLEATVGDYYANFGRGLILSVRKVDELGVDTTLRGAKVALNVGDLSVVGLAGWANIQNVDEARAYYTDLRYSLDKKSSAYDTQGLCLILVVGCNDFVTGAHVDYRIARRVTLGAHGLYGSDVPSAGRDADRFRRVGAMLDAPRLLPWLAAYAEYSHAFDVLTSDELARKPTPSGDAFYASTTMYAGRTTFVFELKDYVNYRPWHTTVENVQSPVATALVYQTPPTLERVITQINNNTDILAARGRVDLRVNSSLLLYASLQVGKSHPTPAATDSVFDFYGGGEVRWDQGRSHLFPLLGYRREREIEGDPVPHLEEELWAFEWDGAQVLGHGWSLETQGLVWLRSKPLRALETPDDNQWTEGNAYVSLKWTPHLILVGGWEFTTLAKEQANKHQFFNASVQWDITPATSLRVFYGGVRPGLKCISGVCRDFPAFEGGKLELVVRL